MYHFHLLPVLPSVMYSFLLLRLCYQLSLNWSICHIQSPHFAFPYVLLCHCHCCCGDCCILCCLPCFSSILTIAWMLFICLCCFEVFTCIFFHSSDLDAFRINYSCYVIVVFDSECFYTLLWLYVPWSISIILLSGFASLCVCSITLLWMGSSVQGYLFIELDITLTLSFSILMYFFESLVHAHFIMQC